MAKAPNNAAAARVRKKVKKNVAEGIAHIHASLTTLSSPLPTVRATLCRGQHPVVQASRVRVSQPPLQRRLQPKPQVRLHSNAG
jgi:hypothetical protein